MQNITINWDLIAQLVMCLGVVWKMSAELQKIKSELTMIRQELALKYEALAARVTALESKG